MQRDIHPQKYEIEHGEMTTTAEDVDNCSVTKMDFYPFGNSLFG